MNKFFQAIAAACLMSFVLSCIVFIVTRNELWFWLLFYSLIGFAFAAMMGSNGPKKNGYGY